MSSVSRELALEATVAFREREYEQAIVALTELDKLLDGGNELVKRNLVVAQWYATQQKYAASFEQWLDLHEAIPDGKRSTDSTFIAQFNRALYCFYANRPQKALTILQAVCFNERKAESRLEVSLVLLALDLFLGERNIRCAIEYFGKLAPDSVDKHATPDKPGYFDIVYRLYEARVQLASGRKWDAVGNLLQLNIPEGSHEDTRRPLYVAHWHLRSQLALACYQTDTPYDLVNWTVDTADTRAIDQNARGCIYLQQGKWGLAAYAFNEATALLDREEKQQTRGQFYRMQHGCCSIREALFINRCLVQLVTGQLIATINQVEEFLVRQLDKQQYTSSIYWLLLGEAIIYLYVDELDRHQYQLRSHSRISDMHRRMIDALEQLLNISISRDTAYSLEYAAACFRQYLVMLLDESTVDVQSKDINELVNGLGGLPTTYRLPYAYGLVAWTWCELQRQEYATAKLLLRQFIDIDTAWLTGDDQEEEEAKIAAQRIKFLSDIYIAVLFLQNNRHNDALTILNNPAIFPSSMQQAATNAAATAIRPRKHAYELDMLTDGNWSTQLRCKRQQLAVMSTVLHQLCSSYSIDDHRYRDMLRNMTTNYLELDQRRIAIDARPSGVQGVDERLRHMIDNMDK